MSAEQPASHREVSFVVNGEHHQVRVEPRRSLADTLRDELGLTGTHLGCEHGVCGSCTVIVDGAVTRACLMFAVQAEGATIETVEGLATGAELNPLQSAFRHQGSLQCGFCTPGFLMLTTAFLRDNPEPDAEKIREMLASNLCRCTGYDGMVDAVATAAVAAPTQSRDDVAVMEPPGRRLPWLLAAVAGVAAAAVVLHRIVSRRVHAGSRDG